MLHISTGINKQLPNNAPEADQEDSCAVARVGRLCVALIVERLQFDFNGPLGPEARPSVFVASHVTPRSV